MKLLPSLAVLTWIMTAGTCLMAAEDDWSFPEDDLQAKIAAVNDGELEFVQPKPGKPIHQHKNHITITASSLADGWIELKQCHENLDPISAVDIVYKKENIRNISIISKQNIGTVIVNQHIINLIDVKPDAKLCMRAESHALHRIEPEHVQLKNGPFMRRFLDGFYPLQVTIEITYPGSLIELIDFHPHPEKYGQVIIDDETITWNAVFEGRLFTQFTFEKKHN